uniref:Putative endo-1,6-alpha-mannosidase n=1 Tax=Flammulina velutipes TaxID=38945 RepID=G8A509_FLAVE|nr:putative endo-1,6-alpha-mannosidase [Flammulina velutipes]
MFIGYRLPGSCFMLLKDFVCFVNHRKRTALDLCVIACSLVCMCRKNNVFILFQIGLAFLMPWKLEANVLINTPWEGSSFGIAVAIAALAAQAQDLGVPQSWKDKDNHHSLDERKSISQKGIDRMLRELDRNTGEFRGIDFWQSGNVYTAMVHQDVYAGNHKNKDTVVEMLKKVFKNHKNYDKYQTKNSLVMLSTLGKLYRHMNRHPHKITIKGKCADKSMEGAVFWRPGEPDNSVNSITTGDAAIRSAKWIQRLNMKDNIVLDSFDASNCHRANPGWIFTYNSGKYMEGLSVLKDVTGDGAWGKLLVEIAAATMKGKHWQGDNGIIKEGSSPDKNDSGVGFKAVFIRGLTEVHERTKKSNRDLQILIHSYVCVQYNAILALAKNHNNEYPSSWAADPKTYKHKYTSWGQLAALDTLVGAIPTTT